MVTNRDWLCPPCHADQGHAEADPTDAQGLCRNGLAKAERVSASINRGELGEGGRIHV